MTWCLCWYIEFGFWFGAAGRGLMGVVFCGDFVGFGYVVLLWVWWVLLGLGLVMIYFRLDCRFRWLCCVVLLFYFFIVVIMLNSVGYFISFCVCDFLGLLFGLVFASLDFLLLFWVLRLVLLGRSLRLGFVCCFVWF